MTQRFLQLLLLFMLASCLLVFPAGANKSTAAPPSVVEAGFIVKFPLFVTWPEEPWKKEGASFVIGVIGDTPVHRNLLKLARYSTVDGSPLEIKRIDDLEQLEDCQLVFIASSEEERLDEILDRVSDLPVLTVASTGGFARRGIHINFYLVNEYVRFEINQKSCEKANLSLSFRLKDVARIVESD